MLTLDEAQAKTLALAPSMPTYEPEAAESLGRYLAADLVALRTQPPADLSAMDGYAVCGDGPWQLIGESRAGSPHEGAIAAGECIRISTGAHMPAGADRVLIQENATVGGMQVACFQDMPSHGQHVRLRGFDFSEGDVLLRAGVRIGPPQIALALAAGHSHLKIAKAPRVTVIDSGDELSADPVDCSPNQIPASNGAMLSAMLASLGCVVKRIGPVPDDRGALVAALSEAEDCDFVVTSGGASVGDHDLMRPALEDWGAEIDFWKVAMKPGKPLMVARRGEQVIFGLPGNPVSSFVTAFLFVLPCVKASMMAAEPLPRRVRVATGCELSSGGSRHEFLRAHWDGENVQPVNSQDSSALGALASSNCLISRPVNAPAVSTGQKVECFLLENG